MKLALTFLLLPVLCHAEAPGGVVRTVKDVTINNRTEMENTATLIVGDRNTALQGTISIDRLGGTSNLNGGTLDNTFRATNSGLGIFGNENLVVRGSIVLESVYARDLNITNKLVETNSLHLIVGDNNTLAIGSVLAANAQMSGTTITNTTTLTNSGHAVIGNGNMVATGVVNIGPIK